MIRFLFALLFLGSGLSLFGQKSAFNFISVPAPESTEGLPSEFEAMTLDLEQVKWQLAQAPQETKSKTGSTIVLPLPNGEYAEFRVVESSLINGNSPYLSEDRTPKSYKVMGPWGNGRLAFSHKGITAMLRGPEGIFLIDRLELAGAGIYLVTDFEGVLEVMQRQEGTMVCGTTSANLTMPYESEKEAFFTEELSLEQLNKSNGNEDRPLIIYDVQMVSTGEFSQFAGGTVEDVMAEFNLAINILTDLYESELGIRFNLLASSASTVFLDPDLDPFLDAEDGEAILNASRDAIESRNIPFPSYDIGHIFTRGCQGGVAGIATFGSVCGPNKTRGVTCIRPSVTVAFMASTTMAHELGHSFDARHTWNRCTAGTANQRNSIAAYEPGSGTTIMSYAGSCGTQDTGPEDPYFHGKSLETMNFFSRTGNGRGCATVVATQNVTPEVSIDYEDGFYIPISTP
ncbi:MAG: reprolysin-like metallopeptidase, partial [Bacteroidota bacterium]